MRRRRFRSEPPSSRRAAAGTALRSLSTVTAMLFVYFSVPFSGTPRLSVQVLLPLGLLGFCGLGAFQVRSITRSTRPWLRAIEVLATAAPLLIVLFAASYFLLARSSSAAFSQPLDRLDALYFTVTVFATVGFGDIVPKSDPARIAVTLQMVGDLVFIGAGLRILLGAVKVGLRRQPDQDPREALHAALRDEARVAAEGAAAGLVAAEGAAEAPPAMREGR